MSSTQNADLERLGPAGTESQRLLAIGGILMIVVGMLFGEVFAMFVLHPNNANIGQAMFNAAQLIPTGNVDGIMAEFKAIGGFLENKGTKVDTHSHVIHLGYIALLLAMLQPWIAMSPANKRRTAIWYLVGASLMPPAIFSIHYFGLAYSPLSHIGWGSIFADFFGTVVVITMFIYFFGLLRFAANSGDHTPGYIGVGNAASRILLVGGLLLLVIGFLYGALAAVWVKSAAHGSEVDILKAIVTHAAASEQALLAQDFADFGQYQMLRGIHRATHAHINEIGILLLLLSFIQGLLYYRPETQKRWAVIAVVFAIAMPFGILLEIPFGIIGSIIADFSGFMVVVALVVMLFGLVRFTGATDANNGERS